MGHARSVQDRCGTGWDITRLVPDKPFLSDAEFTDALAAIAAVFSSEVKKKTTSGKPLRHHLWLAAAPENIQWLLNGTRVRHTLSPRDNQLLASGSTANEALHHEMRAWIDGSVMYGPVLQVGKGPARVFMEPRRGDGAGTFEGPRRYTRGTEVVRSEAFAPPRGNSTARPEIPRHNPRRMYVSGSGSVRKPVSGCSF